MANVVEPKKPMSAYFLYVQENRDTVQKELGVKDFGPVTKCLSERWKTLSPSVRSQLDKKAADLKATYEKELAAFKAAGGVVGAKRKEKRDAKADKAAKKAKKEANADKPRKPAGGAYGIYVAMNREQIMKSLPAGSPCTAVSKVAGARFKALGEKEKAIYEAKYQEKKAKYEEELAAWKAAKGADGGEDDDDDDEEEEDEKQGDETAAKKLRKAGA